MSAQGVRVGQLENNWNIHFGHKEDISSLPTSVNNRVALDKGQCKELPKGICEVLVSGHHQHGPAT